MLNQGELLVIVPIGTYFHPCAPTTFAPIRVRVGWSACLLDGWLILARTGLMPGAPCCS